MNLIFCSQKCWENWEGSDEKSAIELYNERVKEFIEETSFENNNMVIIDRGRTFDERSAVLIENGIYKGYCFYELNYQVSNIEILKNIIIPMQGEIDSMNVSVASAILIFEAKRQRGF